MSDRRTLHAFKETDRALMTRLVAIATEGWLKSASITIQMAKDGPGLLTLKPDEFEKRQAEFAEDGFLIGHVQLSGELKTTNAQPRARATLEVTRQPRHDTIEIHASGSPDFTAATQFVRSTLDHFRTFEQSEKIEQGLGEELAEFYQRRETALLRIEDATQQLVEKQAEYQTKLSDQTEELRNRLHNQAADLRDRLQDEGEAHQKRIDGQHADRVKQLDEREAGLDARKKDLDDRDSKQARRDIQKDLKKRFEQLDTTFGLSSGTQAKRTAIHVAFNVLVIASLAGTVYVIIADPKLQATATWIKMSLGSVAFFAFAAAYLGWMNHWFRQHADEEFRLKRLAIDMDRASWLVETVSEWQAAHPDQPLPDELLRQVGGGLFDTVERRGDDEQALEKLLGAAARLQVKTPGTTVEFDRRSMRKMQD